jgi:hypothetical protein
MAKLDPVDPVVFFDALRVKVRDGGRVKNKAVCVALALSPDGGFPTDEAALKLLYLAIKNAGMRWRRAVEWTAAMGQFAFILPSGFPDRRCEEDNAQQDENGRGVNRHQLSTRTPCPSTALRARSSTSPRSPKTPFKSPPRQASPSLSPSLSPRARPRPPRPYAVDESADRNLPRQSNVLRFAKAGTD